MALHKTLGALSETIAGLSNELADAHAENVELTMELTLAHAEIQSLRGKMANPPPAMAMTITGKSKAVALGPKGKRSLRKPISARDESEAVELAKSRRPALPFGYRFMEAEEDAIAGTSYYWKEDRWVLIDSINLQQGTEEGDVRIVSNAPMLWAQEDATARAAACDIISSNGGYWNVFSDIPKWDRDASGWKGALLGNTHNQLYYNGKVENCLIANPAYWGYDGFKG